MCFSATGSLTLATVLTGVGAVALAQNPRAPARMLAAVPALFAAQQAAEGGVWLTFGPEHGTLHAVAVAIFLGFALVVWPSWVPIALFRLETARPRRRLLAGAIALGLVVSLAGAGVLIGLQPHAVVATRCIRYDYGLPGGGGTAALYLLVYTTPTVLSFFASTLPLARTMGTVLLVALVATLGIEHAELTSVWCFFATAAGVLIVASLRARHARPSTMVGQRAPSS